MNILFAIVLGIIGFAAVIGVSAIIKAKLPVEKLVGLDVITTLVTAVLVILSVLFDSEFVLDIAIVYAVLSFGAVIVIARFKERGME